MNKTWKIAIVGALAAGSMAALAALPFRNPKVVQELGLTQDQVSRLEELQYAHQKATLDIRHDLRSKNLDLRREMAKESPDPAVLDKLVDETGAIRTQLRKRQIHHLLEIRKVLTPEQWEKAKARILERMDRQGDRGRRHEGRGEGRGRRGAGRGQGWGADSQDQPGDDLP